MHTSTWLHLAHCRFFFFHCSASVLDVLQISFQILPNLLCDPIKVSVTYGCKKIQLDDKTLIVA